MAVCARTMRPPYARWLSEQPLETSVLGMKRRAFPSTRKSEQPPEILVLGIGTGVADDKSIYPDAPRKFDLGETAIQSNVPTYVGRDPHD